MDFVATPVIDFLADGAPETGGNVFCDPLEGGCGHFLTCHTRGMVVHDRCLMPDCDCEQAVLQKEKHGKKH